MIEPLKYLNKMYLWSLSPASPATCLLTWSGLTSCSSPHQKRQQHQRWTQLRSAVLCPSRDRSSFIIFQRPNPSLPANT